MFSLVPDSCSRTVFYEMACFCWFSRGAFIKTTNFLKKDYLIQSPTLVVAI